MKKNIVIDSYKEIFKASKFSAIISLILYMIEGVIPAIITYVLTKLYDIIEKYTVGISDFSMIIVFSIIFIILNLILLIIQVLSSYIVNIGIFEKVANYCKLRLYNKSSKLNLILYEDLNTYNLKDRAESAINRDAISNLYMSFAIICRSLISFFSIMIVLATYSLWFVLIGFLSVIPFFFAKKIRGNAFYYLKKAQVKKERKLSYLWSLLTEKDSIKELRTQQTYHYIYSKFKKTKHEVNNEIWEFEKKDAISMFICDIIKIIGYALCIVLSFALVIKGSISIGAFGACLTAFVSTQNSIKTLLIRMGSLSSLINFAKNYFEYLDISEKESEKNINHNFGNVIEFKNVFFQYPSREDYSLKNISFNINKGEKVILVGVNGSGKTTLVKLLLGAYDTNLGNIFYDGYNLNDINREVLYNNISIVSQEFNQFQMSLRENIGMSDINNLYNDDKIIDTLKSVDEKILLQVNDIDKILGKEFGDCELSGGQWQKIAIARGIFKDSELIILDEPTASLDPNTEYDILTKFIEISKNKTSIIVSHRIGLCKYADKIIVMNQGEIVGVGKHDELIQNCLVYKKLYNTQKEWYVNK